MISIKLNIFFALNLLLHFICSGQNAIDSLITNFNEKNQGLEENIHLHLNKSVYVKGEDIGYTAYVIDQRTKQPSLATTNLYVQLLNDKLEVVHEKLLLVENGVTTNVFETNGSTPAGGYSIKAFTNWMRNFDQPLFAQEPLRILDPSVNMDVLYESEERTFTLSILPEGGHAVDGVFVKMGAILKDQNGYGVSATGNILKNGEKISKFSLDENGIGSFLFLPDAESEYKFSIELPEQQVERSGLKIEDKGVSIAVAESQSKVYVNLRTNDKTLEDRRGEEFIVAINDHQNIKVFKVSLKDYENLLAIERDSLTAGMNQISYFTQRGVHLGDRLYFNREGLNTNQESKVSLSRQLDSLNVNLEFKGISKASSSVSVLPGQSKALPQNHIISDFYLSPYVKGNIQDPSQYFDKNDRATDFALDNLLLTQGWSMHDWRNTFDTVESFRYNWEDGITVTANLNSKSKSDFLLLPGRFTDSKIIALDNEQKKFSFNGYFPTSGETLKLSAQNKRGKSKPAKIYPRFKPSKFPSFKNNRENLSFKISNELKSVQLELFDETETLSTVIVEAQINEDRNHRIRNSVRGRIEFFNDADRMKYINIDQYLRNKNFRIDRSNGTPKFFYPSARLKDSNNQPNEAVFVLNDQTPISGGDLQELDMSIIDYIELDLSGTTLVFGKSGVPVIKIYFNPNLSPYSKNSKFFTDYLVPLTFEMPAKFYTPIYFDYSSNFFNMLGVIDWQGKLQIENGRAEFTMPYVGQDTMWFMTEGIAEDGTLIYSLQQASISK